MSATRHVHDAPAAPARADTFPASSRLLHWLMAVMVIAMLFIGAGMASTIGPAYAALLSLHRPLGIAVLLLVIVRLVNRFVVPPPSLPASVPPAQRFAAGASHALLYALMLAMPLLGWAMLSAGGLPIPLFAGLQLPPILPADAGLHALLRRAHGVLGYAFFAVILLHLGAALLHGLILRDGVLPSMASLAPSRRRRRPSS